MTPRAIKELVIRDVPLIRTDTRLDEAVRMLLGNELPALPVVDERGRYAGIFGEREFIAALFPGYVEELHSAGFVPKSIEAALKKRESCRSDPVSRYMNTEHVAVPTDFADIQLAETFLHHRVSIAPITSDDTVEGVITRTDFVAALAARLLDI